MGVINNVKALISTSKLTNLANAIRNKTGEVKSYTIDEMIEKINGMKSSVLTSLDVTTNGTYTPESGVDGFSSVTVDVNPDLRPLSVSENGQYSPDGFDGYSSVTADIEPNLTSLAVTENGLYLPESGTDGFDRVNVDVPIPTFETEEKTINVNGVYLPSAGKDGISKVTVDVPSQAPVLDSLSVTENGTYTPASGVDGFNEVVVDVPTGGGGGGMTATGAVEGNGTNILQIPCDFEPDLVHIQGDLSADVANRGIVFITIIKDMDIYYGLDSSTSISRTNAGAIQNITGYNESDTSDIHATYSNNTLSIDTAENSGSWRWPSGITYSYKLIKFG